MRPIEQLISAMAYATFEDSDIEQAVEKQLRELDTDLDLANYDYGELVDRSTTALETVLNTADERAEARKDDDDEDDDEDSET